MINQQAVTSRVRHVLMAFFIALVFVTAYGYTFNGGDQEEVLPYLYKLLRPELYPHDYLVPLQVNQFTIRWYLVQVLYTFSRFMPVPFAVAALYFSLLTVAFYTAGKIGRLLSNRKVPFIVFPLTVFVLLNKCTIGGNVLEDPQLSGSVFSIAFSLLGIRAALRGQPMIAGAWIGVGTLFQLLFGLDAFVLAGLILFFRNPKNRFLTMMKAGVPFMAIAAFVLVPIGLRQMEAVTGETSLYSAIMFHYRMPHHYLLCAFSRKEILATVVLWCIAWASKGIVSQKTHQFFRIAFLLTIVCLLLDGVLFQWGGITAIAKLQLYKMTVWCTIAAGLVVAEAAFHLAFCRKVAEWLERQNTTVYFVLSVVVFTLISITAYWPPHTPGRTKFELGEYPKDDLTRMHEWIAVHTPVQAVFLPMPDDESFLCQAKRSIPVAWKGLIHEPVFMLEWYSRFNSIYGVALTGQPCGEQIKERALIAYPQRPDSVIRSPISIDYRIWDTATATPGLLTGKPVLFRSGTYVLVPFYGPK